MKTKQHIHNKQIHLIDSKMTEGISKEIFHGKVASILIKINHVNRIFFFFFFNLRFNPNKAEQSLQGMESQKRMKR